MKRYSLFLLTAVSSMAFGEINYPLSESLAEQATDFTAPLLQLQLEDWFHYTSWGVDSYANTFVARPVVPIKKTRSIPFEQLIRVSVFVKTTPKIPRHVTGVGDTQFLDLFLYDLPAWGRIGFGPIAILPTATNQKKLGQGKWQLGPAFAAVLLCVPHWQFGLLAQNPWSCGIGNSSFPNVVSLFLQPLVTVHFSGNWYLISNAQMTFQWNPHMIQIPVNIGIGKVATIKGVPINAFMETEWVVYKTHAEFQPHFTVKIGFNFLFPECKPKGLSKAGAR
ncbi:MAG: hypothetical protein Q8L98_05640 [Chlamydiales bacterium]|nr:hypothetical protein [Chlamydiales bacterium]